MRFIAPLALACASAAAFNPGGDGAPFSLSAHQRARARETSAHLDASRFHFQILFVDDDNFRGRIAEGILSQIAEYNDAQCVLFPYSATIEASRRAPADAAAPPGAVAVCDTLGLCPAACAEDGTSFDLSSVDQYDLVIAMDDEIQSLLLRSLPADGGRERKCRALSEFASVDFCGGVGTRGGVAAEEALRNTIEPRLWDRVLPFYDLARDPGSVALSESKAGDVDEPRMVLTEGGAAAPNPDGWPLVEATMVVACAGVVRFCLDTMDAQFDAAFSSLLDLHFNRPEHLEVSVEEADDQLRLGSQSVTGYFSLKERHARINNHFKQLRSNFS